MINITFPDKSVKKYESSINGLELAKSISNSLAKSAVCIEINGELKDLSYLIEEDSVCKIFTKDDQYSLDTLRHSTAHVLAQAVLISSCLNVCLLNILYASSLEISSLTKSC